MKYWCLVFMVPLFLTAQNSYESAIIPFLKSKCIECHGGKKVKGKVDFTKIKTKEDILKNFEIFESALELIHEGEMPPEEEPQPSEEEVKIFESWYKTTFVDNIVAQPAPFKPRRLSVNEYKNTLEDLFGFELEVAISKAEETVVEKSLVRKILPKDPPGKSGFQNDTNRNPLTSTIWDGYSYIIDSALDSFFSKKHRKHLVHYSGPVDKSGFSAKNVENLLTNFLPMAFRRPVAQGEINQAITNVKKSKDLLVGLKSELKSLLMSPRFIYRGLMMKKAKGQNKVDHFELAERLSYFIWGSMPDATLMQKAEAGKLADKAEIRKEIDRMIGSKKSRNLSSDFAYQWFAFNEMDNIGGRYPTALSLKTQPQDFFNYLITEDRPLMELIDSKVTFANPLLQNYYKNDRKQINRSTKKRGIEQMFEPLNKITLAKTPNRGGIITMPGILAMNATKGRTSPILRGTWILERILGDHLPEPPMDVGQVPKNKKGQNLTFRQRFDLHKANKTCAVCHDKIDPLGFALESYDPSGYDRLSGGSPKKKKGQPAKEEIHDTSGNLYGEKFKDFNGLKKLLIEKHKEKIVRNIVRKTMAYALCRKLEYFDSPTIEAITKKMLKTNGTYKQLIFEVVTSLPFTETIIQEQ